MPIHRPRLRFRKILFPRLKKTKYVVVHHVAKRGRYSVQDIHQWHLNKKWAGIGYHYYVRKDGEIYRGRPRNRKGAHVNDEIHHYNSESIGVCFEGDFNTEEMGEKQLEASIMLLSVLSLGYGNIDICRHKDLDKRTSCPGKNFPMETLRERVESQKQKFIDLYGDPKEVNYKFLLKLLD